MMMKSRESKMLKRVRRWRKAAFGADKTKTPSVRAKEDEKLAMRFDLRVIRAVRTSSAGVER